MIFVDSNIPMYLVGSEPRYRLEAAQALEHEIARGEKLVTNASACRK